MFSKKCQGYGSNVDVYEVLSGVLKLIRIHRISIGANYATLVVNALCIEALAKKVCPEYNVLDGSKHILRAYYRLCNEGERLGRALFNISVPLQYFRKSVFDQKFFLRHNRLQNIGSSRAKSVVANCIDPQMKE